MSREADSGGQDLHPSPSRHRYRTHRAKAWPPLLPRKIAPDKKSIPQPRPSSSSTREEEKATPAVRCGLRPSRKYHPSIGPPPSPHPLHVPSSKQDDSRQSSVTAQSPPASVAAHPAINVRSSPIEGKRQSTMPSASSESQKHSASSSTRSSPGGSVQVRPVDSSVHVEHSP